MALTIKQANQRLLKLAKFLEEMPEVEANKVMQDGRPAFCMDSVWHWCTSPSCAWGWYVSKFRGQNRDEYRAVTKVDYITDAEGEFKLTTREAYFLFGAAERDKYQEAQAIREFVAERTPS